MAIKTVSDSQKTLQGHKRFVKNVPTTKPISKMWNVPPGLGAPGKKLWKTIGPLLVKAKVLTDLDKPMFRFMCERADMLASASKTVKVEGFTVMGHGDIKKSHPALAAGKSAFNDLIRLMEKFGLSPADRGKIDLPVDANPRDKHRDFLFGDG